LIRLPEAITRANQEIAQRLDPPPDPGKAAAPTAEQDQEHAAEPSAAEGADQGQEQDPSRLSWAQAIVLLCSIPGINRQAAEGILAEIGIEMSCFPTSGRLASWADISPRQP
jgi:transposase